MVSLIIWIIMSFRRDFNIPIKRLGATIIRNMRYKVFLLLKFYIIIGTGWAVAVRWF